MFYFILIYFFVMFTNSIKLDWNLLCLLKFKFIQFNYLTKIKFIKLLQTVVAQICPLNPFSIYSFDLSIFLYSRTFHLSANTKHVSQFAWEDQYRGILFFNISFKHFIETSPPGRRRVASRRSIFFPCSHDILISMRASWKFEMDVLK